MYLTKLKLGLWFVLFSTLYFSDMCSAKDEDKKDGELSSIIKNDSQTSLLKTSLFFEKNSGQLNLDDQVKYFTKAEGCTYYFTSQEVIIELPKKNEKRNSLVSSPLKLQFIGSNQDLTVKGVKDNEIPNYSKVVYENLYSGIDAIFYGNQNHLEYDLCVAPQRNPQDIRLHIDGAKELSINSEGDLVIQIETNEEMQMDKPIVYQMLENGKIFVEGNFVLLTKNEIGFAIGNYNKEFPLTIDPTIIYSTFAGGPTGSTNDLITDNLGNAYIAGSTASSTFPVTSGAFQTTYGGGPTDAFILKMNSTGTALLYSTFLGGSGDDIALALAIDSTTQNLFVTGLTNSLNFPTTTGVFQQTRAGTFDAFVTGLTSNGSALVYSTYLGGTGVDQGTAIAVNNLGEAYVAGSTASSDFPTTSGVFQTLFVGTNDAFVTHLSAAGSSLMYSTFLGGSTGSSAATGIKVNSGEAYVVGNTTATNFPTTFGAFQSFVGTPGNLNAFVTRLNATATAPLVYSTYLGGSGSDTGSDISVDSLDNAYIVGFTTSNDFPTTPGAFQTTYGGGSFDAFITKLNATGTGLFFSTYLGGSGNDAGNDIVVDIFDNIYVTGSTTSTNFPTTAGAFQSLFNAGTDAFFTSLDSSGSFLLYSTYIGGSVGTDSGAGIDLDLAGSIYIGGSTTSSDFPTTAGAYQTQFIPTQDPFIIKFGNGPNVTSLVPNFGPESGGTIVTITGSGFVNVTSVEFGGNPAAFIVDSPTQITAIAPPGVGVVDVTVTTVLGTSAITPDDQFTYIHSSFTSTSLSVTPNPAPLGQPVTLTAVVAPPTATGTVTFFDGTTPIATVPLVNGTASIVISSFTVGQHFLTAVYSGDADFTTSTSPIVILTIETALPPSQLRAVQRENKFATQTDIINILTWNTPSGGILPVEYRIYRNEALTRLIAVIPANERLRFEDHNRKKDRTYTYWVVSVDQFGNVSAPAVVRVR